MENHETAAAQTGPVTPHLPPAGKGKATAPYAASRPRGSDAKIQKLDDELKELRDKIEGKKKQRIAIARENRAKAEEKRKAMETSVNRHLSVLAKLAGMDFRTPDGKLNSRSNNLNEALIAGALAKIKRDIDADPMFADQLEEEGRKILAERSAKAGKK